MGKVKINRGRDFQFTLRLRDKDGNIIKLTGFTKACLQMKNEDDTILELSSPLATTVNEIQDVAFATDSDAGSFKLNFGGYVTAAINFDDSLVQIADKINALKIFSEVLVTGAIDLATGLTLTFSGNDGGRDQALPSVESNSLTLASVAVAVTPAENVMGVAESGLSVDAEAGEITVKGSEKEADALASGENLTGVVLIRVGAQDLNIDPLTELYDMVENPLV